ncbi:MAG TPA: hypothetical protein DIT64_14625 [Verrucomicrobiales bacterium]|nr:hypothetical protein [Verrucomicrobiales bacterium]
MSSRPHLNGNAAPRPPTHSGSGALFPDRLWARMDSTGGCHEQENDEAIGILAAELRLTQRQAEVLHWVAQGKTNEETATILGCGYQTIKTHLKDIYLRLGVNNRAGAIGAAYDMLYRQLRRKSSPERGMPEKSPAQ